MNAPTEKERALANLRHLYTQMVFGTVSNTDQAKRIAEGLLSPAIAKLEQAARRAPAAPVPQGWIDPNDKAQKQYLPHIGERVLFKHDGRVYLGKHTGGSFKAEYPFGNTFGTWDCMWMYPSALDAAAPRHPEAAPVELPEPAGWIDDGGMVFWNDGRKPNDGEIIYTEQQVRDLLAAHGIGKDKT